MTTFYICRHGETENNKNKRLSGWIDTPLTDEGIKNATAAVAKLQGISFDKIMSSDLGRAFITAYLIARQLGYTDEIQLLKDLREVDYGDLTNMKIAEAINLGVNIDHHNPTGETLDQMQQRVLTCVAQIAQDYPDQTILLAAHDGTINALRANFLHEEVSLVGSRNTNSHDFVAKLIWDDDHVSEFETIT